MHPPAAFPRAWAPEPARRRSRGRRPRWASRSPRMAVSGATRAYGRPRPWGTETPRTARDKRISTRVWMFRPTIDTTNTTTRVDCQSWRGRVQFRTRGRQAATYRASAASSGTCRSMTRSTRALEKVKWSQSRTGSLRLFRLSRMPRWRLPPAARPPPAAEMRPGYSSQPALPSFEQRQLPCPRHRRRRSAEWCRGTGWIRC